MSRPELALLVLKTSRMDDLRAFYRALGVEFAAEKHGAGPEHFAGRVGGVVLEIYPLPEGADVEGAAIRLGFIVEDLRAVLKAIDAPILAGARMTDWGDRAVVRDPDGRTVELSQRKAPD